MLITENFTLEEFTRSSTAKDRGIDNTPDETQTEHIIEVAKIIQQFRDFYGKPVRITSGFRCPVLNRMVGGSPTSVHMTGYAVDFTALAPSHKAVFQNEFLRFLAIKNIRFDQVIFEKPDEKGYCSWIHIGLYSPKGEQRRQILINH